MPYLGSAAYGEPVASAAVQIPNEGAGPADIVAQAASYLIDWAVPVPFAVHTTPLRAELAQASAHIVEAAYLVAEAAYLEQGPELVGARPVAVWALTAGEQRLGVPEPFRFVPVGLVDYQCSPLLLLILNDIGVFNIINQNCLDNSRCKRIQLRF